MCVCVLCVCVCVCVCLCLLSQFFRLRLWLSSVQGPSKLNKLLFIVKGEEGKDGKENRGRVKDRFDKTFTEKNKILG